MSILTVEHVFFTYDGGHAPVFEDLNLRLDTGWKLGVVGRNGRGKTTLLRLLAGEEEYRGRISGQARCRRFPCSVKRPSDPTAQVLARTAPDAQPWQLVRELSLLGLGEEVLERPFSSLSGGEQNRVLLAALFLEENGYSMLDEPTNHMDHEGRELIGRYLAQTNRGFLLVSHNRAFLDRCTDHTLALNRTGPELLQGSFSVWYREKQERDRREQRSNEKLRGEISRLEASARERKQRADAVERAKIGGSKDGGTKSGLRPYLGEKSRKGQQQRKNLERRQQRAIAEKGALLRDTERADTLTLTPAVFHSSRLLELSGVSVDYGAGEICKDISFTVKQGDRVCLQGRNGSGKTSLLRLLLGEEVPHSGGVWRAPGLEVSYVPQQAESLYGPLRDFPRQTGIDSTHFMTMLRKLDFPREAFERDMGDFSAGQKKKVLLAASLCRQAHLYIWDEPLNYIDLHSRIQLEQLILECRPTLLFVEHDEMFRQNITTKTVCV